VSIAFLDPANAKDVEAVATLHEQLLGDSPIAQLGPRFLREFFYGTLVADRLIRVFVCHLDGGVIGFLSYTRHPLDFIGRGVKRHPFRLGRIMIATILSGDRSVSDLWKVAGYVLRRGKDQPTAQAGSDQGDYIEAISLVTPPQHQKHVPPGGKSRLTIRLVETMAEQARAEGIDRVIYMVQPKNTASNLLFNALGCDFEKRTYAGVSTFCYTHRVQLPAAHMARG
jgi:hypothetical protein